VVVDVGLGAKPDTTVELAEAVHRASPALVVIGVDIDPYRVATARQRAGDYAMFRVGSFELPLEDDERVRVVRAMNLLREYHPDDVEMKQAFLGAPLEEGGLLLEGSTDDEGHVVCAHVLRARRGHLKRESLLFLTDFGRGFSPNLFRDWLPQDLRGQAGASGVLTPFFASWSAAFDAARADLAGAALPALFDETARRLSSSHGVRLLDLAGDARGLVWTPSEGVPRRTRPARSGVE